MLAGSVKAASSEACAREWAARTGAGVFVAREGAGGRRVAPGDTDERGANGGGAQGDLVRVAARGGRSATIWSLP